MLGNRLGQGIDISFNMDMGMSMVEGCTVVGGQQGITTHSSRTEIIEQPVSRTTGQAIAVDEMSMGMASHNTVRDALGVGLYCGDRSMCMFDHNTVIGTRPDTSSGLRNRRGFAVFADFQSEADLWRNSLAANPVAAARSPERHSPRGRDRAGERRRRARASPGVGRARRADASIARGRPAYVRHDTA